MSKLLSKARAGFYTATAAVLGFGTPVFAASLQDDALNQMKTTGDSVYGGTAPAKELPELVGSVINIVLGLLGIILVCIIIFAGFLWMTAQGDAEKVKKAKAMIGNAVVGMVLIFAAYSISSFVITKLVTATVGA